MADIRPRLFTVEILPAGAGAHALTLAHLEKFAFRPHIKVNVQHVQHSLTPLCLLSFTTHLL